MMLRRRLDPGSIQEEELEEKQEEVGTEEGAPEEQEPPKEPTPPPEYDEPTLAELIVEWWATKWRTQTSLLICNKTSGRAKPKIINNLPDARKIISGNKQV